MKCRPRGPERSSGSRAGPACRGRGARGWPTIASGRGRRRPDRPRNPRPGAAPGESRRTSDANQAVALIPHDPASAVDPSAYRTRYDEAERAPLRPRNLVAGRASIVCMQTRLLGPQVPGLFFDPGPLHTECLNICKNRGRGSPRRPDFLAASPWLPCTKVFLAFPRNFSRNRSPSGGGGGAGRTRGGRSGVRAGPIRLSGPGIRGRDPGRSTVAARSSGCSNDSPRRASLRADRS